MVVSTMEISDADVPSSVVALTCNQLSHVAQDGGVENAPPSTVFRSHVFVWETSTHFLGVHLMSHELPMPSQALKNIAHLAGLTVQPKLEQTAKSLAVIHYVPHHRVIDLTLMETQGCSGESCSASLLELRELADSGGIKPFLAKVLLIVDDPLAAADTETGAVTESSSCLRSSLCLRPKNTSQNAVFEMRYNDVSEILTTNFACVVHKGDESFVTNSSFRGTHELLKEFFEMCRKNV